MRNPPTSKVSPGLRSMNSISAGCEGTVTHVLANDAEPVDVGQLLIIIDPKA